MAPRPGDYLSGSVNLASEISRETTRAMPSVRKPADTNHRSQSTNQQRYNAVMHSLRKTRVDTR